MTPQIFAQTHRSFDLADSLPSGHDAEEDAHVPIYRLGKTVAAAFLNRCARMLPTDWRILLWSKETDETIISSHGSVQIRRVPGGCLAQTCVKGDITLARGTALLRLAKYVSGDNQGAARLDAERPLLQQRKAPGLWQVAVRLIAVDDVQTAPMPRARKIKIVAQGPSTWAVVTRRGRPTEQAIERAETAIKDTIARTQWFATGSATGTNLYSDFGTAIRRQFRGCGACLLPCSGPDYRRLHPVAWYRTRTYQPSRQPTEPIGSLIAEGHHASRRIVALPLQSPGIGQTQA